MISFYVFINNIIFHQGQQTNENQARELYTKWTEKFVVQMKKGKRKFHHANYLKYRDNFNITPTGVGLLPTNHDKNNERSSGIRPLGL